MAITGFDLESFTGAFDGGARSYLFMYEPTFPSGVSISTPDVRYLVRSSSFPETTLEEIVTNWQGQDMKFAAKKTFSDWTISFNVNLEATIRNDFEAWTKKIHDTITSTNMFYKPSTYYAPQVLYMLGLDGEEISKIQLLQAWPKSVGAITLDYSSTDVAQFDVTFSYNQHLIGDEEN